MKEMNSITQKFINSQRVKTTTKVDQEKAPSLFVEELLTKNGIPQLGKSAKPVEAKPVEAKPVEVKPVLEVVKPVVVKSVPVEVRPHQQEKKPHQQYQKSFIKTNGGSNQHINYKNYQDEFLREMRSNKKKVKITTWNNHVVCTIKNFDIYSLIYENESGKKYMLYKQSIIYIEEV